MPLVLIDAVSKGRISLNELVKLLSENPAKMYGTYPLKGSVLAGTDADLVIVDMDKEYTFHQDEMHSRTKQSGYDGWKLKGAPVQTILRGVTVAKDREIIGEPMGHFVKALDNGVLC